MKSKSKVLVVGTLTDPHINAVTKKILDLGIEPTIIDTTSLGTRNFVSVKIAEKESQLSFRLQHSDSGTPIEANSVWVRRPEFPKPASAAGDQGGFFRSQWNDLFAGLYKILRSALWVSDPDAMRVASYKPYQLAEAAKSFNVPRTLISNDPMVAEGFCGSLNGKVVAKTIGRGYFFDELGVRKVIPTSRIHGLAGLAPCPMILSSIFL